MNKIEAQQQLDNYARQQQRLQRHYIVPMMLFSAIYALGIPLVGGFGTLLSNLVFTGVFAGWFIYSRSRRLNAVSWRTDQQLKFTGVLFLGWMWLITCNAYFVNWNPHDLPLNNVLGGVLAALPFLVLARTYRP